MKLRSFFNRPATSALIAAIISLLAWGAMAWGLSEPGALVATEVTPRGIAIGAALLPALIMPVLTLNFLWAARKVRAARRGENVIGRWIVSATELAAFAANNAARNALGPVYHNEWKPPRKPPAEGIEIIFVPDGVVVGSAFYSLVTTGPFRFTGVQELRENPPAVEFGITTFVISTTAGRNVFSALRLPVSLLARGELGRVFEHFRRVANREVIVNRDFYRLRIRIGLIVAAACAIFTAGVTWIAGQARENGDPETATLAEALAGCGVLVAATALVLALISWKLQQRQYRG